MHRTLSLLGSAVRRGWIADLPAWARALQRLANCVDWLGSEDGAMHVSVTGVCPNGERTTRIWTLLAENDHGPDIPATASVLLAKRILGVEGYAALKTRGAMPCVGLLTLGEFENEWRGRSIRTQREEHAAPR